MLNLRAFDLANEKAFYYDAQCQICGDIFIYKSPNGIFRQIWDKSYFELDFQTHRTECLNQKVMERV